MRAQRAKLKSRRDDRKIGQDKRSAVQGNTNKMNISLFQVWFCGLPAKPNLKKRREAWGGHYPGRRLRYAAPCPGLLSCSPSRAQECSRRAPLQQQITIAGRTRRMHWTAGFRLCYISGVTGPPPVMSSVGHQYRFQDYGNTERVLYSLKQPFG